MYERHHDVPDSIVLPLTQALQPLIARYGFTSHASFMSEVEETKAICRAVIPKVQEILPGAYGWFRIVGLLPSQQIVAHADPPIAGMRYHLPIQTTLGCWTWHAGVWQQLQERVIYRMDPTEIHGAVNWGETLRVHLLIDVDSPV